VEDRLNAEVTDTNAAWIERALAGDFVGGGWTEANNGTFDALKTVIAEEDGEWYVTGAKFYATGSLYADWLDVLGQGPDGTPLTALVRVAQPGVEVIDDWPGFGQRATGSGSANYDRARIEPGHVIPLADRAPYLAHFYQEAMLSALAGVTAATQRDGIAALRDRKRAYRHATTQSITDDPQLLQVIGRLSAHAYGARAALSASAASLDRVAAVRIAGDDPDELAQVITESNVEIAQAQVVIIDHALEAATIVFDALGASGVSERLRLDRHWRNARTLASHNPRIYKERLLGDWFVNGRDPLVASGLADQGDAPAGPVPLLASQA
jgi:alkylation response protein AidB-like acyl-CoA dehydrogenase